MVNVTLALPPVLPGSVEARLTFRLARFQANTALIYFPLVVMGMMARLKAGMSGAPPAVVMVL